MGLHMGTMSDLGFVKEVTHKVVEASRAKDLARIAQLIQHVEHVSAGAAAQWTAYVLDMGASPRIVDVATRTANNKVHCLDRSQLLELDIVNVDD